jgi:hypothetical protein
MTVDVNDVVPGSRWTLNAPRDMFHLGVYVPAGSIGSVSYVDDFSVCLRLDDHHEGLDSWNNEIVFTPEDAHYAGHEDSDPRRSLLDAATPAPVERVQVATDDGDDYGAAVIERDGDRVRVVPLGDDMPQAMTPEPYQIVARWVSSHELRP